MNAYSIKDVKTLELEKSMTTLYGPTKKSFPNKGEREHLARIASFLMEKSKFCLYCLITEYTTLLIRTAASRFGMKCRRSNTLSTLLYSLLAEILTGL